ncbi:MAG: hypothetical protein OXS29_15865 [bacterium]|nr:hypothetical protein [bacterium]MDE0289455.1 hypothetical protein [bacterium]MDE0437066.1 hypothetical protein [bacterium]
MSLDDDVRQALAKLPDRLLEHQEMVLVVTNRQQIGASSIQAARSAAGYVAHSDHQLLSDAVVPGAYIETTRSMIERYGDVWFSDESQVIRRERL